VIQSSGCFGWASHPALAAVQVHFTFFPPLRRDGACVLVPRRSSARSEGGQGAPASATLRHDSILGLLRLGKPSRVCARRGFRLTMLACFWSTARDHLGGGRCRWRLPDCGTQSKESVR